MVSHRSTDWAITSLTSEIGRDPVLSGVYGRSYKQTKRLSIYPLFPYINTILNKRKNKNIIKKKFKVKIAQVPKVFKISQVPKVFKIAQVQITS